MDLKSTASGAVNGATDTKVNAGVKAKAGAKQNSGVDASESQNAGVQANGSTDIGTVKESTSISRIKGDADVSVKAKSETRATVGGQ